MVWRFGDLDMEFPPAAKKLSAKQFFDLHDKLGAYETQTVSEVFGPADNGCKTYAAENLPTHTGKRLLAIRKDDETELHCLRLTGKYRVHGLLRENVYYVLWIDPEHEVWPSTLRNT